MFRIFLAHGLSSSQKQARLTSKLGDVVVSTPFQTGMRLKPLSNKPHSTPLRNLFRCTNSIVASQLTMTDKLVDDGTAYHLCPPTYWDETAGDFVQAGL